MTLKEHFESQVAAAQQLSTRPSNEDLLMIYGLYKQATVGDNLTEAPGGFDFKAAAKYNSWKKLTGTSQEEAMQRYIDLIERLKSAN